MKLQETDQLVYLDSQISFANSLKAQARGLSTTMSRALQRSPLVCCKTRTPCSLRVRMRLLVLQIEQQVRLVW